MEVGELTEALIDGLAEAIGAAIDAACAQLEDPAFAFVHFGAGGSGTRLPGPGWVADHGHVAASREVSDAPDSAISLLTAGPPHVVELDVAAHADPETLRLCRELTDRLSDDSQRTSVELRDLIGEVGKLRAWELVAEAGRARDSTAALQRLREQVGRRVQAAPGRPLVVWMPDVVGEGLRDDALWEPTIAIAGPERVEALRLAMAPGPRPALPGPPSTRAELTELALAAGLSHEHARRIAAAALPAFALRTTRDRVRSHLGGEPELPRDQPWPEVDGRPLAFLASLALDELGPNDLLPPDGRLLFFADLAERPSAGGHIRVLHVQDGEPRRVPDAHERFEERRVRPVEILTVPDAARLGLDPYAERRYAGVTTACEYGRQDQVLGHPQLIQLEGDDVLLAQLTTGHRSFCFLATPAALRERRWEDVTATDAFG